MKKIFKKYGAVKCTGGILGILGLLLAVIAAFLGNAEQVQLIMRLIACLFVFVGLFMMALMAENNKLVKVLGSIILSAIIFSWILPYGYFSGAEFTNSGMRQIGFADFGAGLYYAVNFLFDKLLFIFVLTAFYGALSKVNAYQQLVSNIAKKLKGHEIITALLMSLFITAFTSLSIDAFAVLVFVPFFIAILSKMKVEKLTTFAITFGSILVGILGTLYGTESLADFNYYLGTEITTGLTYRGIILAIAFILYNFFIVMRLRSLRKVKNAEIAEDPFEVEVSRKKAHVWPAAVILVLLALTTILGYIAWNTNWGITFFDEIHEKVLGLSIGENTPIISYILGSNVVALGAFQYLYTLDSTLIVCILLLSLIYWIPFKEIISGCAEGVKKALKPVIVAVGVYFVFFLVYMSPFTVTLTDWAFGLTKSLNPIIASIVAFITSIFSVDFGYTAYSVGQFLTTTFTANIDIIHAIYSSMYGLVQMFMPTSIILMIGLTLLNVDYKSWFKYIWLFVVGMFIILIVLFSVVLYV